MNNKPTAIIILSTILIVGVALVVSPRHSPNTYDDTVATSSSSTSTPDTLSVNLFFYRPQSDMDENGELQCSSEGLAAVSREIEYTETPLPETLRLLLEGDLSLSERQAGITTEFPIDGLELVGVSVKDRVATVALDDPNQNTSGGACRAQVLRSQITNTALQFSDVSEVRFIPETLFQP